MYGTADAENKASTIENSDLPYVLPLKPGVGQNTATHASPTAGNVFLVLISTFPVHSSSFPGSEGAITEREGTDQEGATELLDFLRFSL